MWCVGITVAAMLVIAYIYTTKARKQRSCQALWHEHAATVLLGTRSSSLHDRMEKWFEHYARLPPQNGTVAALVSKIGEGDSGAALKLSQLVYDSSRFYPCTVRCDFSSEIQHYAQLCAAGRRADLTELYKSATALAFRISHLNWTPLSYVVDRIC